MARLGFLVPLPYSAIDRAPVTHESLVELVRSMHWQRVAMVSAGVATISWRRAIESQEEQEKFVAAFTQNLVYGSALMRALHHDSTSVIFTRECFLAVLRIALSEMSEGDSNEAAFQDRFTRSCLSANTLLAEEITSPDPKGDASDLLRSELRSIVLQAPLIHEDLGRTDAFIRWLDSQVAKESKNSHPLGSCQRLSHDLQLRRQRQSATAKHGRRSDDLQLGR